MFEVETDGFAFDLWLSFLKFHESELFKFIHICRMDCNLLTYSKRAEAIAT